MASGIRVLHTRLAGLFLMLAILAIQAIGALAGPGHTAMRLARAGQEASPALHPVAVFGKDDRRRVPERLAALASGVGLLVSDETKTSCTAFCVSENVIATAAHCILSGPDDPRLRPGNFFFRARQGDSYKIFPARGADDQSKSQNVMLGAYKLRLDRPIDASADWALVRLVEPACRGRVLQLAAGDAELRAAQAGQQPVFQIGHHADLAFRDLAYSDRCRFGKNYFPDLDRAIAEDFANAQNLILHRCDTGEVSSGSPIFSVGEDGIVVVGMNVGTYSQQVKGADAGVVTSIVVANTGIRSAVFARQLAAFSSGHEMESTDDLRTLQSALLGSGLYAGPLDGSFNPLLRGAILAYESSLGLPVTGLPTLELMMRLGLSAGPDGNGAGRNNHGKDAAGATPSNIVQPGTDQLRQSQ